MLVPVEVEAEIYSDALRKPLDISARATINFGRNLKLTTGWRFTQEISIENMTSSQDIIRAMELDPQLQKEILILLINKALNKIQETMENK